MDSKPHPTVPPTRSASQRPVRKASSKASKDALVPENLPESERIDRQNDLA